MHLKRWIIILFLLCLFSTSANAQTYYVGHSPQHAQDGINEALKKAYDEGGGVVILEDGEHNIDGPIYIGSNTVLYGSKNAIITVSKYSSQWFVGTTGIINALNVPIQNVEISGFQINGNLNQLPRSYANYNGGDHNAERAIYLQGSTTEFMKNILVHDLQIYDCYSDGIHIQFAEGVKVYNNLISDCQHSGIFLVAAKDSITTNNRVAGITSDCLRYDNCVRGLVTENLLYSFTGYSNGAYQGGQNMIQIADQGFSHGGGSDKPTHTEDIEVYGNVFASDGLRDIWLDSSGKGFKDVFIHDNQGTSFFNDGHPVNIDISGINASLPISNYNPPSKETSEKVFDSIFDILSLDFVNNVDRNSTAILPKGVSEAHKNVTATITRFYNNKTLVYVPSDGLTKITVRADGNESTHVLMLGEPAGDSVIYTNASLWEGSHVGESFCFDGYPQDIQITCYTPKDSFQPEVKNEVINSPGKTFNPWIIVYFLLMFPLLGVVFFIIWFMILRK